MEELQSNGCGFEGKKMKYFFSTHTLPADDKRSSRIKQIETSTLKKQPPLDCTVFLVDASDSAYALTICQTIRQHVIPAIYLRPIILVSEEEPLTHHLKGIADGQIHSLEIDASRGSLGATLDDINQRIIRLPRATEITATSVGLKIIRYLSVRQKQARPVQSILTKFGFSYPDLELFFKGKDETVFKLLNFLKNQGLFSVEFVEKAYFCNQCNSAFLNFLEICPHCESSNLLVDDLIHHYQCAHIGPSAEFHIGGKFTCPKCEQPLKHIGVDFDKPSIVYTCNECSHVTQDPTITTNCYNCGRQALPEKQVHKTIYAYKLTALGENASIYGLDSIFRNILDKTLPLIPYETFQAMLRVEIKRIGRYKKTTSTLLMFQIVNLDAVYLEYGSRAKEIFSELSNIMTSILRDCDVITSITESIFLALLVETPEKGAAMALQRLQVQVDDLLDMNLQKDVQLKTQVVALQPEKSAQETITYITEHAILE